MCAAQVEKVSTWGKGWRQTSEEEPRKTGQSWVDDDNGGDTEIIKA
jgi:hypothetical protein